MLEEELKLMNLVLANKRSQRIEDNNKAKLSKQEKKARVGQVVDEFIKSTKEEVKSYKKEAIYWNPKK